MPSLRIPGSPLSLILPLATCVAVLVYSGCPPCAARPLVSAATGDRETAHFAPCTGPQRVTCVVDGDTFWYRGEKIRIADINTPETSQAQCPSEAALGARATRRLTELLNAGAFTLVATADGRDRDRYGRLLRDVTRNGTSLGATLEAEGLAEHWQGRRRQWCTS